MNLIRKLFGDQMTETEYAIIPTFESGDCVFSIAGDQNLVMHIEVTNEELDLFQGGA